MIPLDELAAAPFPKLVISGGHNAAFDAVCDVLEERLPRGARGACRARGTRCRARRATTRRSSRSSSARRDRDRAARDPAARRADERAADVRAVVRPGERARSAGRRRRSRYARWADGVPVGRLGARDRRARRRLQPPLRRGATASGSSPYGFRRDRWGRGYATEAARACVRYGFESSASTKIVADVDPGESRVDARAREVRLRACRRARGRPSCSTSSRDDARARRRSGRDATLAAMELERVRDLPHDDCGEIRREDGVADVARRRSRAATACACSRRASRGRRGGRRCTRRPSRRRP